MGVAHGDGTVTWKDGALTQFFVPDTYEPTPNKINDSDQTLGQSMNPAADRAIEVQIASAGFSVNLLPTSLVRLLRTSTIQERSSASTWTTKKTPDRLFA